MNRVAMVAGYAVILGLAVHVAWIWSVTAARG
jgi:hypothetical protein